ncbi:globin [Polaribacter sp. ALD11]|uniref:group III truncated hemoglobin n=1 Tax=Polaribacter sp. ALD11 TaxID=2058137 RepID=UPI000C302097|nr:group III truncated hemoglobin [Polaribacter sp. ALD11]AUC84516.1 globin [Polaribacter sp. ALD11]
MELRDIENRADIFLLVTTFYNKIKEDPFIGPIFLEIIPENEWESHLEKLTDFWETNLFFVRKFKGNPMKAHKDVDAHFNHTITQKHFGKWLELWFTTVDALFEGTRAHQAKERARNIAASLFLRMFEEKPKKVQ